MPQYMVIWKIEVDAESPEDAAKQALEIQRDRFSEATVFTVLDEKDNETEVDVEFEPGE